MQEELECVHVQLWLRVVVLIACACECQRTWGSAVKL